MAWFIRFVLLFSVLAIGIETASSSTTEKAIKSLEATLAKKFDRLIAAVNVISQAYTPGNYSSSSCKEIYNNHRSQGNRAYLLQMPSGKVSVYCHMTSHGLGACGGGGWTLVMKTDGTKRTFHFSSKLSNNRADFNRPGGKTLFDNHETKLPTYWETPFSKICLGMRRGHITRFVVIPKKASSLHALIADGNYRATSLGRITWKSLIGSEGSLQPHCNKEGFNVACTHTSGPTRGARIGILGNEQNDCITCDSRIGFGTGGAHDDTNSCGNEATQGGDNGDRHIKTMGFILVQ